MRGARPSAPAVERRAGRATPDSAWTVWLSLPRDVKALVLAGGLALLAGLGWTAFGPPVVNTIPPLLGYLDAPLPAPTPTPGPPVKLPWWR